jgi:hypothetical protein
VIKISDCTRDLLCRFVRKGQGPARIYASAVLDLLAVEAGEKPEIIFTLRQLAFEDLLEGVGGRAKLLGTLLDTLKDNTGLS